MISPVGFPSLAESLAVTFLAFLVSPATGSIFLWEVWRVHFCRLPSAGEELVLLWLRELDILSGVVGWSKAEGFHGGHVIDGDCCCEAGHLCTLPLYVWRHH